MARHGRKKANRGGARGGARGGSRGGARGGGHGAKRGGGRGGGSTRGGYNKYGGGGGGDFPELFDLNDAGESSMRAAAKRTKGRRTYGMQSEAFQTEENRDTVYAPCRKRPVEFVLSTLYDPTRYLITQLANKGKKNVETVEEQANDAPQEKIISDSIKQQILADIDMIDSDVEVEPQTESNMQEVAIESPEDIDVEVEVEVEESKPEDEPMDSADEEEGEEEEPEIPDDQLFFVDDEGEEPIDVKTVIVDERKAKKPRRGPKPNNLEFDPVLSIGHVHLPTKVNRKGQAEAYLPKVGGKNKNLKHFNPRKDLEFPSDEEIDEEEINYGKGGSNKNMYQAYNNYISRVLQNMNDMDEDEDEEEDDELDLQQAQEEADFLAEVEQELENFKETTGYYKEDKSNSRPSTSESITSTKLSMEQLKIEEQPQEPQEPAEPEFGFLPEDLETFDGSLLDIINIRFGSSSNQYFLRSFKLLGDNEHQWIDDEILTDFLLENGLPEHRLNAYFTHIHNLIAPPEPEISAISNFEQVPISDSDTDEDEYDERNFSLSDDDDYEDEDNEGLEDLINYTKKYDGLRDMDIEPTQTLKTKGKGRKKELDLDHIHDMELRQSLADQFQIRRASKKASKSTRESNIEREHANSKDLLLKYPFSFHVKDIRNEFESFLHDSKRNALAFPPMDVHAIKTIGKFAYYYNMKHRKFGQGLKMHGVVVKNKRTFHSLPDYHSIGELMKQRRVFNRTDQKRPKTEIEQEEAKSSRRGKPSKAFVKSGDVVGADAPEISGDNIGRKLLMKMGWSTGQGLGLDNRGVPEPVVAIVKNNKAGLR